MTTHEQQTPLTPFTPLTPLRAHHSTQFSQLNSLNTERGVCLWCRDLKPQNFLYVDESPTSAIKCSDYGLAITYIPEDPEGLALNKRAGTPVYMAPEVVLRRCVTKCPSLLSSLPSLRVERKRLVKKGPEECRMKRSNDWKI